MLPEASVKAHAVIFDMDGVLFDTERLCASVWSECSRVAGYAISDEVFRMCVGRNDADTRELLRETLGSEFPYDTFKERVRLEMKSVMEANGPPPKKGAAALLQYLSDNQIPAALATSTSEETARWMIDKAGFSRFFSAYAFGSEVSKGKPDPEIFILARNRLQIKDSSSCIVFEDSPAGIRASHTAGMNTVFVPDMVIPESDVLELVWKQIPDLEYALYSDFFTIPSV